jgi:hypothetical protein
MPFNFPQHRTGRLEHSPEWLSTVDPHVVGATGPVPASIVRPDWQPSLVDNLILPTCSVASLVNNARIWSIVRGGFDLVVSDPSLLAFYAGLAPCADTIAAIAATEGLQLQSVLQAAQRGLFTAGQQAPMVPLYRAVPATGEAIRDAINASVSVILGVTLYQADIRQGAEWRGGFMNAAGDPTERHAILVDAYDAAGMFSVCTWGQRELDGADEAWITSRTDEAYALIWTMAEAT